jgi:membrane protein DedA with SNARE-associated domain
MWSVTQIESLLVSYGYALLLPVSIVEGPIVTVLAGALAGAGYLDAVVVFAVVVLGDLIGDSVCYAIGRWGGPHLLRYAGRYLKLTPDRMTQLRARFVENGRRTLAVGKWTHSIGALVLVAAGAARMPFVEFLLVNLVVTLPKSLLLLLFGYFVVRSYAEWEGRFAYLPALLLVIGLGLLYLLFVRPRNRRADP